MDTIKQNIHEQIAWELTWAAAGNPNAASSAAWIVQGPILYYARFSSTQRYPWNAVVNLIQGIFETYLDQSFFILRERIYTTEKPSVMSRGMVKVTAKRLQTAVEAKNHGVLLPARQLEVLPGRDSNWKSHWQQEVGFPLPQKFESHQQAAACCQNLAKSVPRGEVLHDVNRPIAAVLIDKDGALLASGTNTNKLNKTLHAEVVTLQNYFRKYPGTSIPEGSSLIVSLKPCVMCAGMVSEVGEQGKNLKVIYLQENPGALARQDFLR